jgi:DNA-binding response OmpR family regulator
MNAAKIFIIDDERTIRLTFRLALETDGYEVQDAASADEAMMGFQSEKYDLVVLDLRIGEDSGLDVLASMRQQGIQTPTLMITAYGSIRNAVRAIQLGAIDFLEKPIEPVALRKIVADILGRHRPRPVNVEPGSFEDCVQEAKRLINLQQFDAAAEKVGAALNLDDRSPEVHNLRGILYEIGGDYDAAKRSYGQAIRLDSRNEAAQQNMRRLYELFNFGSSQEVLHLGSKS